MGEPDLHYRFNENTSEILVPRPLYLPCTLLNICYKQLGLVDMCNSC